MRVKGNPPAPFEEVPGLFHLRPDCEERRFGFLFRDILAWTGGSETGVCDTSKLD